MLGRLLATTLDMVWPTPAVDWYRDEFFKGNYTFDPNFEAARTA
jgi:hypothetical protein